MVKKIDSLIQEPTVNQKIHTILVEQSPNSVVITDRDGLIQYVNQRFQELTGYTQKEVEGKNPRFLKSGTTPLDVYSQMWTTVLNGGVWRGELCNRKKNLELFWEYAVIFALCDEEGNIIRLASVKNDITERKKAEELNIKLLSVLNETGRLAKVGGWSLDIATRAQTWTEGLYHVMELDLPSDTGKPLTRVNFYSQKSKPIIMEAVNRAIFFGEAYDLELEIITAKGNTRWVHATGKATQENGVTVTISGAIQDITDHKNLENSLRESEKNYRRLSMIDTLTNLYNRRHFNDTLEIEIARARRYKLPLTIIFFDIDNFKVVNDVYGHDVGDRVLTEAGKVTRGCIRVTDCAHRYGGEEFTVILPSTSLAEGVIVAKKIKAEFTKQTYSTKGGKEISLTLSLGVTEYRVEEKSEAFVKRADDLMYQAKKLGKDRICFESYYL